MNRPFPKATFGFLLIFLCEASFAQEWVKPSAGRPEYVQDRTACVQEAQSMVLAGEAFDKDIVECLVSKGWQRSLRDNSMPVYCAEKEGAVSCKPGGTEEMYKRDRADCTDYVLKTVGNTYVRPGWWGLGGLIVSAIQGEENKNNLRKSQLTAMKYCLEGRNWTVAYKGEAKALMEPSGNGAAQPTQQAADYPPPTPNDSRVPPNSANSATRPKVFLGESKFMIGAERQAKLSGCIEPLAVMNSKDAGIEQFTVACSTGAPLSVSCDYGGCRILK